MLRAMAAVAVALGAAAGDAAASWDRAHWIGAAPSLSRPAAPGPLLRREFTVRRPVTRARVRVSALGLGELRVNGRRASSSLLEPAPTRYDRRVLYVTHDVTRLLRRGRNAIGLTLGRGLFAISQPNVWGWHQSPWRSEPRAILELELRHPGGSRTLIASDRRWRARTGPTTDALYSGETFDGRGEPRGWARPGFDDSRWRAAAEVSGPGGRLAPQVHEPSRVVATIAPRRRATPVPGVHVLDFGGVLAGWVRIRLRARRGTAVTIRYGERLGPDGRVEAANPLVEGPFQTDRYIAAGRGLRTWEPRFTYKGFRYAEVTGWPGRPARGAIEARVVHTAVRSVGRWASSSPALNRLHAITRRTLLNNLQGLPIDTPAYEKNGWTGDAHLASAAAMLNFDMRRIYAKWLADMRDSQRPDGLLPAIVPDPGRGLPPFDESPTWGAAAVLIPWGAFMHYGDRRLLARQYRSMRRYVERELKRSPGGLHTSELGDWMAPGHFGPPPEDAMLAGTAYAHLSLATMARAAAALSRGRDAIRYRAAARRVRQAFNQTFLDAGAGVYRTGGDSGYRQTSQVLPLALGLVAGGRRDAVLGNLVADVRRRGGRLDTGALGTKHLLRVLTAGGYQELALRVATQPRYPGWGYWLRSGATTLWEQWERDSRSLDHVLLGVGIADWLYGDLAGLRPTSPGWRRIEVRPHPVRGLRHVVASVATPRGRVAAAWRRRGSAVELALRVPSRAVALVRLPAGRIVARLRAGRHRLRLPISESPR
jgi:alpha-L-rhamnosidase